MIGWGCDNDDEPELLSDCWVLSSLSRLSTLGALDRYDFDPGGAWDDVGVACSLLMPRPVCDWRMPFLRACACEWAHWLSLDPLGPDSPSIGCVSGNTWEGSTPSPWMPLVT